MSKGYYPDVQANPDFPSIEEAVLGYWAREGMFKKSVEARPAHKDGHNNEFIFYDGPPFANGLPHYGHLLTGYVKDVFARYETMKGKRVERRFGWDCHGLPAEMGSEKELGISGRQAIIHYGIDKFNEHCRTSVMKYTHEWETYVTRQARWVDFKGDYKTMDTNFMESVLWAFKKIYDKGWVYEAYRVMPYSWAAETPLSNFETKLDNSYREKEDKAVTVAFELDTPPAGAPKADKYYVLAWTTTPWTLPSNLALAVGREVDYRYVVKDGICYIIGANAIGKYTKELQLDEPVKGAIIETTHLYARPFTMQDVDLLYGLHSSPDIGKTTIDGVQTKEQSTADLEHFIAHQNEHGYSQWAVFEKGSNAFVGRAGLILRAFDESAPPQVEVRYALHKDFWGKGYATELAKASISWGFKHLKAHQIVAGANPDNLPSHKVLEKCGMHYVKNVVCRSKECVYYALAREDFRFNSADLIGLTYKPLFPYFADRANPVILSGAKDLPQMDGDPSAAPQDDKKGAFRILDGSSFVTDGDGTGIVHMAPGFGEEDQKCCEKNDIEVVVPVDGQGKYTDAIFDLPDLQLKHLNVIAEENGQRADEPYKPEQVKKYGLANLRIITWLKEHGHLIKQEEIRHNYPHCWRTDKPLIYRAMPSWYVEVTKFRDRAAELNQQINWIPAHIRDGQMGHMLATAPDWSISRNRFWGTPIPVWRSPSGKIIVIGSIKELEELSGKKVKDLHRPTIDDITIDKDGETYTRVEDVFDCWFESGSMPFAQVHYPFENKDWFENHFPADFITEYVGQTRGWFNTLIMLSTALFDKPPFKNCICHGVVLDAETGLKYSKRLKNYKDPLEVINQFGADALRWLMIASPVMRGQDLMVDPDGKFIRDVVRLAIKPIWNAYNFFCLYANADGIKAKFATDSRDVMDRYILAKCKQAVATIEQSLDAYDTPSACDALSQFFEALNNWYIRRNKERFWKHEQDADKQAAYDTLYTVLTTMCRAAAPLLPLTLEDIYRGLTGDASVHLADFPSAVMPAKAGIHVDPGLRRDDEALIAQMDQVRDVCNAALGVRNARNIRVRQPLKSLTVAGGKPIEQGFKGIIQDEVNVKEVKFDPDFLLYASFKLQINSAVVGKKFPAKMKQILAASKQPDKWFYKDGILTIEGEKLEQKNKEFTLVPDPKPDYKERAQPLSSNDALVILDTTITPELEAEGIARDLVRMIQQARKDADLNVSDKIDLHLDTSGAIAGALKTHASYIMEQTLSKLSESKLDKPVFSAENTLDDQKVTISIAIAA